jgi:hypothetical protein
MFILYVYMCVKTKEKAAREVKLYLHLTVPKEEVKLSLQLTVLKGEVKLYL